MNRLHTVRRSHICGAEALESRLALAGLVTFMDVDGDTVTVKSSKGTTADLQAALVLEPSGLGNQLRSITVTSSVFQGTTLSVTARAHASSDGRVHVGHIDATGRDLKGLTVAGDLGRIRIGDATAATPAFASLTLQSLGAQGLSTGAPDLATQVAGRAGSIKIAGDVVDATILHVADSPAAIASLKVGGSLIRGIVVAAVSSISIGGDVVGGGGESSGTVLVTSKALSIGGDVIGSTGERSGCVLVSGKVSIGGSVTGAAGIRSGMVRAQSIAVGGDVSGGTGLLSGALEGIGKATVVTVKGSISGNTGYASGWVHAETLKSIVVGGGVAGLPLEPVGIVAESSIGSVKIGQTLRRAVIRAGFGAPFADYEEGSDVPSVASIGAVTIRGNCIESSIVAGATPGPLGYGIGDTTTAGNTRCSIGVIKIGGGVTESTSLVSYGFVGRSITSLSIAGQRRTLPQPGQSTQIDGSDVRVHVLLASLG